MVDKFIHYIPEDFQLWEIEAKKDKAEIKDEIIELPEVLQNIKMMSLKIKSFDNYNDL